MKKASRFWIWLFLFSLFPVTTSAQVQRYVSKQEALSIAQGQFRGQDVDYYLIDETCVISCPVAEGAENVSLDTSRLSRGVYVVSYSVNSELIDQKKVRLD